jgi:hypothetical protein
MILPLAPHEPAFDSQPCGIEEVKDDEVRPEAHPIVCQNDGLRSRRAVTPAPKVNIKEKPPDP